MVSLRGIEFRPAVSSAAPARLLVVVLVIAHLTRLPTSSSHSLHGYHTAAILRESSSSNSVFLTTTPFWLNQTRDHFAPENSPKFAQRYFEFLDYFDAPHGPIFLIICGEATCGGILNDYIAVLGKRFGAALVTLEHRYYGYSYPFENLVTENLKYLTSKQALFDLATFRNYYQDRINKQYNLSRTAENSWISFGGSYSGALSAWFRLKFPHLTRGSLASSAVVHAIEDFSAYDRQVAESVGPSCTEALQEFKTVVNEYLKKNSTYIKSIFNAQKIEKDTDLLSLLADSAAVAVQYGFHEVLCRPLVESFQSGKSILNPYQDYVRTIIYGELGVSPQDYDRAHIKNAVSAGPQSAGRLWTYQSCTEFGFFQIAPSKNSIRFSQLNREYYLDLCTYMFGKGTRPRADVTNLYYGGTGIAGSRIFFTNGSKDPWRHASKQVSSSDEPAFVVECKNCAHCVDLSGCPQFPFNPEGNASLCEPRGSIDEARNRIARYIDLWLSDPI